MAEKFQNKYRIGSTRLQNWDYGWAAAYFVTICTHNREHYFGEVVHDAMRLSPVGAIADVLWYEIKNHAKNIELDVYQVMPNHFHGILILNNDPSNNNKNDVDTGHALYLQSQSHGNSNDPENLKTSEHSNKTIGQQRFQNQGKNTLSSIVGGYKSAVTKHANRLGLDFAWQSRFYDHIIRDNESYERIRNYIVNNPRKWDEDKFRK